MRILLTNDDGIEAPGLVALTAIAAELSRRRVDRRPGRGAVGTGHSLTLTAPIRLKRLGERRFAVRGTPTDSVMMALGHVMKDHRPDLILSGVNRGAEHGRGRDLFGHRLGGDGGVPRRRPLDRAEPGDGRLHRRRRGFRPGAAIRRRHRPAARALDTANGRRAC